MPVSSTVWGGAGSSGVPAFNVSARAWAVFVGMFVVVASQSGLMTVFQINYW
jgi:hypothetical protein